MSTTTYSRDSSVFTKWRTQVNKNIRPNSNLSGESVHICPAVWDSSVVCKDTKNKQKKIEELADKLGSSEPFYFSTLSVSSLFVFCLICCFT